MTPWYPIGSVTSGPTQKIYWLNTGPTKVLQLVNNNRPGDNNICHINIGSVTSGPTQKFIGLTSDQQKYYNWSITSDQVTITPVT